MEGQPDFRDDVIFGLARLMLALVMEFVDQKVLDRERLVKPLRKFSEEQVGVSNEVREATTEWTSIFLELLERDPQRAPAAPLVPFPKK